MTTTSFSIVQLRRRRIKETPNTTKTTTTMKKMISNLSIHNNRKLLSLFYDKLEIEMSLIKNESKNNQIIFPFHLIIKSV
jgi:hypothetical protein